VLRKGGYHLQKREYDEDGLFVKISYYGLDGNLVNRSDNGIAFISYKYDANHRLVETISFDKKGKKLKL
jgi:YD repeat-containing protein